MEVGCLANFDEPQQADGCCQTEPGPPTAEAGCGRSVSESASSTGSDSEGDSDADGVLDAIETVEAALRKLRSQSQLAAYERRCGVRELRLVAQKLTASLGIDTSPPQEEEEERAGAGDDSAAQLVAARAAVGRLVVLKSKAEAEALTLARRLAGGWGQGGPRTRLADAVRDVVEWKPSKRDLNRAPLLGYPLLPQPPEGVDVSETVCARPESLEALRQLWRECSGGQEPPSRAPSLRSRMRAALEELQADQRSCERMSTLRSVGGSPLRAAVASLESACQRRREIVAEMGSCCGDAAAEERVRSAIADFPNDFGVAFVPPEDLSAAASAP